MKEVPCFDNHDPRIRYYELMLQRKNMENIKRYPLPAGYRFVFYHPGDRDAWIEIEKSAKEFSTWEQGIVAWKQYYEGRDDELVHRMVFIETEAGEKIATATAYYDVIGGDVSGAGWLHWVAVKREYQRKGLARPLISYVLYRLTELGYQQVKIPTQTVTWVACKIYMDFGFRPIPENAISSRDGWRIMKALTNHPALCDFEPASLEDIICLQE